MKYNIFLMYYSIFSPLQFPNHLSSFNLWRPAGAFPNGRGIKSRVPERQTAILQLELPINLSNMSQGCGTKLEYLDGSHTHTGRTEELIMASGQLVDLNSGLSCCEAMMLTAAPLCS